MEKKVDSSIREADAAENKLELMEAIIKKLKVGSEEIYLGSKCGATPVLSLLGAAREKEIARPFINENNIVMYLDMVRHSVKNLCFSSRSGDGKQELVKPCYVPLFMPRDCDWTRDNSLVLAIWHLTKLDL